MSSTSTNVSDIWAGADLLRPVDGDFFGGRCTVARRYSGSGHQLDTLKAAASMAVGTVGFGGLHDSFGDITGLMLVYPGGTGTVCSFDPNQSTSSMNVSILDIGSRSTIDDLVQLANHAYRGIIFDTATPSVNDRNSTALERCSALLTARRGLLRDEETVAFQRQLNTLLSDEEELIESGITVSTPSLDGLLSFVAKHKPVAHPNLSLAKAGLFAASWANGKMAKLSLNFGPDGGRWNAIIADAHPPVRADGAFVIDSLSGISQPFRSWIKR